MNSLGQYRSNVTANWPIAASFDNYGQITYVAHNYREEEMIVFVVAREKASQKVDSSEIEEEEDKEEQTFRLYAGALVLRVSRFRRSNRRISRDSHAR